MISKDDILKSYQSVAQECEKAQLSKNGSTLREINILHKSLLKIKDYLSGEKKKIDIISENKILPQVKKIESALSTYHIIVQCCEKTQQNKRNLSLTEASLLYDSLLELRSFLTEFKENCTNIPPIQPQPQQQPPQPQQQPPQPQQQPPQPQQQPQQVQQPSQPSDSVLPTISPSEIVRYHSNSKSGVYGDVF